MSQHRIRLRFGKEADLRFISHRDMVRVFERLFRRAEVPLAMSQGFHPHPIMTFPEALALGIEGIQEVADVGLTQPIDPLEMQNRLNERAPKGLTIHSIELLSSIQRKVKVNRVQYEARLLAEQVTPALQPAVATLANTDTLTVWRRGKEVKLPLADCLEDLNLDDNVVHMTFRIQQGSQPQPRDVLNAIGFDEYAQTRIRIVRTGVEISDDLPSESAHAAIRQIHTP